MVLVGKVNREIVSSINVHGALAVGLSGEDAGLIEASARHPDLGFVGDVKDVNPAIVERLLVENLIPVVSTIGSDLTGQAYNINADTVAGALAEALGAEKIVYLTDVPGLLRDVDDPESLVRTIAAEDLQSLVDDGTMDGGMIPKVAACIHAVGNAVGSAHVLDGRIAHVLLLEVFTDQGRGNHGHAMTSSSALCAACVAGERTGWSRHDLFAHADLSRGGGDLRARSGHRAVGRRGQPLP